MAFRLASSSKWTGSLFSSTSFLYSGDNSTSFVLKHSIKFNRIYKLHVLNFVKLHCHKSTVIPLISVKLNLSGAYIHTL